MAMGFSTPTGSLKPSSSPSFWFSSPPQPCRFSAWTRVTSSSSFPKMSPRWDHYYLWTRSGPSSSTTNFSSSNKFQRNPRYSIRTYTTKDTMCKIDKTVHQYRSEHRLKYVLRSSSTSSAPTLLQESDTTCFEENRVAVPGDYVLRSSSTSSAPTLLQESDTTCLEENLVVVPGDYYNGSVNQHDYCGNNEDNECTNIQNGKAKSKKVVPHGMENCSDKLAYDISKITGSSRSQDGSVYIPKSFSDPSSISEISNNNEQRQRFRQSRSRSSSNGGAFSEMHKGARTTPCLTDVNQGSGVNSNRKLKHGPTDEPSRRESINTILLNGSSREFLRTPEEFSSDKFKSKPEPKPKPVDLRKNLSGIYENVLVINNISSAKKIVRLLTSKYRDVIHACDTEVAKIDLKQQTPVDHGEIICFSIYSGPEADFGNGKSCIWVDVLDGGGRKLLMEFAPFFEDSSIKKVWHNYSFDSHVIENYGIKISGFHADTMHMARLWDSSRRTEGGYSLEALTGNSKVMNGARSHINKELIGKVSMKTIFGKKKLKKDGNEGKITIVAPVEELQREEQNLWICYSALDSMSTLQLYESLKCKLQNMVWSFNGVKKEKATMYNFYEEYWRPFGELLVKMETEGMLVDREYLAEVQKVATQEKQIAENRFRKWAAGRCPDAVHMNVGSDAQLRQLFFGGIMNSMDQNAMLPVTRIFKVPNVDKVIEEGKKVPSKQRSIKLGRLSDQIIETEMYTPSGWPSVSGDALKVLAGKVSSQYDLVDPLLSTDVEDSTCQKGQKDVDISLYGTAYKAFGGDETGKEACHAIAALCEVCSIDSLISNFILPLQSNHISGKNGRIHCSLNINTETGRLSARRPNLQNQPALEKDRYKIRQAFIAAPGSSLIVADYGQLELRILAHLTNCTSMKNAFKAGGDFHSRTAMNMYSHIREAVENKEVLLEWYPQGGEDRPSVPLLKDAFASERRKAKMLNFSIAYGKTPIGLARDWKVSVKEARETVDLWYKDRKEVRQWQEEQKKEANTRRCVKTLLGRTRSFPSMNGASNAHKGHIERAAINTPVQGSAADVAMCAMLEISRNAELKELGWRLLLQVHDEVILEGPTESAEVAKDIVIECMSKPFGGKNILTVDLAVDAKCAQNWYAAK